MHTRIAVLIPVYNNWPGLQASLRSLARQSAPADVLVVDDGSAVAVSGKACRQTNPNCSVIRQFPNAGIVAALNLGARKLLADGYTYIARLDAGDLCATQRIERQSSFLDDHPEVMLLGSDTAFTAPSGEVVHLLRNPSGWRAIQRAMHLNSCVSHASVMMRRELFESVGMYDPGDDCAEDYGLFFRTALSFPVANLNETLTVAELGPSGISLSRRQRQLATRLRIQLRHFDPGLQESYLGLLQTVVLMLIPTVWILRLKRWLLARRRQGQVLPTNA